MKIFNKTVLEYSTSQKQFHVQSMKSRLSSPRFDWILLGVFNSTEEALAQSDEIEKVPNWRNEICVSPDHHPNEMRKEPKPCQ